MPQLFQKPSKMLGLIDIVPFVLLSIIALPIYHYLKAKIYLPHPPSPLAWPIIGHLHLIGPVTHRSFHHLSSLYGPLISLKLGSTPCVVASTPELAKELLKTHEHAFSARKQSIVIKILTKDTSFAFSPYGPYWKFVKKMCTVELLGSRTLNNFANIRKNELIYFLRFMNLKAKAGEAVNVTEELLKLTNNVISEMMLSIRCSSTKGDADEARTLVREVTQIFGGFNISDSFGFLKSFDLQGLGRKAEEIHRRYDKLLESIIISRENLREKNKNKIGEADITRGDEGVRDFLDMLLDVMENEDSEVKLTRDHIKALVLDFFTAATDTSAIAIEWALAEIINNPKVLKKAQEEIDHIVGANRLVCESDGPNLPYIQAVIKETFRLHPPIPMISRKSTRDCTIGKYIIKANTLLFVNIWAIGRNPKYWESPLDFRPARFLGVDKGGLMDVKGHHFELLPFGTGRRGCPGISLAMQELPIVLAGMIQCFEWKVVNKHGENMYGGDEVIDMSERPGLTAPRAHDLVCVPVARNDRFSTVFKSLESGEDY